MAIVFRVRGVWLAQAAILLLLFGCGTVATFDTIAFQNAVQLKFETLALIDKSGDKFAAHQSEVAAVAAKYDSAFNAASNSQNNQAVAQAWQIIRGAQSGSAGEYFQTWQKRGTLRPVIRSEKKAQIGRHFDYVICLETAKQGGPACTNPLGAAPSAPPVPTADTPAENPQ